MGHRIGLGSGAWTDPHVPKGPDRRHYLARDRARDSRFACAHRGRASPVRESRVRPGGFEPPTRGLEVQPRRQRRTATG